MCTMALQRGPWTITTLALLSVWKNSYLPGYADVLTRRPAGRATAGHLSMDPTAFIRIWQMTTAAGRSAMIGTPAGAISDGSVRVDGGNSEGAFTEIAASAEPS
jgi:hypothetical protein